MKTSKNKLLAKGILLDLIGMSTLFIPGAGMFIDILWAPYAARQMNKMYEGRQGKIASIIVFLEEILPGLDVIPTFTLMWLYTFVWKKETLKDFESVTIEV